jgi:hypothetical protein
MNLYNFSILKLIFDKKINLKILNSILKILYEISKRLNVLSLNNNSSSAANEFTKLILKFNKKDHLLIKNNFYKFLSLYN